MDPGIPPVHLRTPTPPHPFVPCRWLVTAAVKIERINYPHELKESYAQGEKAPITTLA